MGRNRSSSRRSSAAIIGRNMDLLMEILLFLPAKSLIRFQLVSKRWRSVIFGRRFSHRHTLHHRRRRVTQPSFLLRSIFTSQFFICHPTMKKLVPFRFQFFDYHQILQSCNGLLLLECRNSPYGRKQYFIFNPTTRKYRNLLRSDQGFSGLFLAFDPSKLPFYKVFCFRRSSEYSHWVRVYDSETHTWKEGVETSSLGRRNLLNGIYWNDGIYFIRPRGYSFCFRLEEYDLYGANREIPRYRSPGSKTNHFMESNEHMHGVTLSLQPDKNYLCVSQMDKEDWRWFIKYEANINEIYSDISLLGMIRGEREEDSVLLLHVPGKIMVYRFCDEVFEVLVDFATEYNFEKGKLQFQFKDAYQLINTLTPV